MTVVLSVRLSVHTGGSPKEGSGWQRVTAVPTATATLDGQRYRCPLLFLEPGVPIDNDVDLLGRNVG